MTRRPAQRQLKVIVTLDGASKPLLSAVAVGPAELLGVVTRADTSVLPDGRGVPLMLIVRLLPPLLAPQPPAAPARLQLTTEDGRVLVTESGVPLVLPDDLTDAP